jgi:hypothetical protein
LKTSAWFLVFLVGFLEQAHKQQTLAMLMRAWDRWMFQHPLLWCLLVQHWLAAWLPAALTAPAAVLHNPWLAQR